jgi:hypothetical protein
VSPRLPANEPRRYPANLTWWFGWLSLVPIVAPAASVLACLNAILSLFLCTRYPEKFTGKARIWMGLGVCALGMALFFAEAGLFFQWKVDQVYEQKMSISRFRLTAISGALERYRQENGGYPDVSGIMRLKALLEPDYMSECPVVDGFDGAISVSSSRKGFTLTCSPPAPPGSKERPSPILMGGHFQPGPLPPPPAPPPEAGAGKAPEGTGAAGETNAPAASPAGAPAGGKSAPINPPADRTPSPGPG